MIGGWFVVIKAFFDFVLSRYATENMIGLIAKRYYTKGKNLNLIENDINNQLEITTVLRRFRLHAFALSLIMNA